MKALVLAAGEGKRLRESASKGKANSPKPLFPLLGLSLIERTILNLRENGIEEIFVVTGYQGEKIKRSIGDGSRYGVTVSYIDNEQWSLGNGSSVLAAEKVLQNEPCFLLTMADHVMQPSAIKKILNIENIKPGEVHVLVDYKRQKVFRIEEATKVRLNSHGRVLEIGKSLKDYNAVDCGVFLCTPGIFQGLKEEVSEGRNALSDGIRRLAEKGMVKGVDIGEEWWIDVDDGWDLEEARKRLLKSLPSPRDGLISKLINRRLSVPISGFIASTKITPNMISFTNFIVACLSAAAFIKGLWPIGGLLAQSAAIIDGVDGEIARLKYMATKYGAYFDSILDRYGDALILFGMTLGWYLAHSDAWVWFMGCAALIGSPMSMLGKEKFHALTGTPYCPEKYDGFLRFVPANRDGRLFLIMLGSFVGQLPLVLGILAVITNFLAFGRLVMVRKVLCK
ncbi:MAG: NTP transferase domain-containing protein [Clostridia bacterium]|nr:NTP transferase domain-containing protein [Clostridia bacterium]